jgi:hypothetical protein
MRAQDVSSYLGQEGALIVGELDLRDVEEAELPLLTH